MIIYIKMGRIRGLSIEINKNFTMEPLYRKNSLHGETIIDIPYTQLTYTSGSWAPKKRRKKKSVNIKPLPLRRASNVNRQDHHATKRARRADGD